MSYVTFYRKYRSQTFSELVGQEHIKETLSNAVAYDRLSHAYIFSGPRGTGKTSLARILAKALNCRQGRSLTPCLSCDICQRIALSQCVDVIEVDAASNTGVDHIRTLTEQIHFAPVECVYKVYIIDEAHMLSIGAFNALLKTLEEPPEKTLFILATTEPQKIPITIHSRCQRLNFRRLTTPEIIGQLTSIAEKEGIDVTTASLNLISKNASGCMRDAVSLLDQVYALSGEKMTIDDVILILGGVSFDALIAFFECLFKKDDAALLTHMQVLTQSGVSMLQLLTDIVHMTKTLMYVKLKLSDTLEIDDTQRPQLESVSSSVEREEILYWLEQFIQFETELRGMPNPELLFQMKCLVLLHQRKVGGVGQSRPEMSASPPVKASANIKPSAPVSPSFSQQKPAPSASLAAPIAQRDVPETKVSEPEAVQASPEQPPVAPTPVVEDVHEVTSKTALQSRWEQVLAVMQKEKPALYAMLDQSSVSRCTEDTLYIKLKQSYSFFKEKFKEASTTAYLKPIIKEKFNKDLFSDIDDGGDDVAQGSSSNVTEEQQGDTSQKQTKTKTMNDIVSLFEGAVV